MLSRYAHMSPPHRWKAVEGLTQVGTVTEKWPGNEETQKLLKDMVSRLGLEPRTFALKARKGQYYQWLDFAKVSPFILYEQGLEMILYIPLIL